MEKKYKSLSYIRELYQAIVDFEMGFQQMYDMTLMKVLYYVR